MIGIYSAYAVLQPEANADGSQAYSFIEDLTFTTTSTKSFSFRPDTLSVSIGDKNL